VPQVRLRITGGWTLVRAVPGREPRILLLTVLGGVTPVELRLMTLLVTGISRTRSLVGMLSRLLRMRRIPRVVGHRGLVTDPSTIGRDVG
jgi:hypothetical protein